MKAIKFPSPPKFDDPYKERAYLKGRLAAAFRIFGKYGYDEGVAGHITMRVRITDRHGKHIRLLVIDRTPLIPQPSG